MIQIKNFVIGIPQLAYFGWIYNYLISWINHSLLKVVKTKERPPQSCSYIGLIIYHELIISNIFKAQLRGSVMIVIKYFAPSLN